MRLLNYGCGSIQPSGFTWDNYDVGDFGQSLHPGDLLPGTYDGIFANHVMTAIEHGQLRLQVAYLFGLLKPGGWVRIADADFNRMTDAARWRPSYLSMVSDETEPTIEGKLCYWMTWGSTRKSAISNLFMAELLSEAGFQGACDTGFKFTYSGIPQLVELDDRQDESWFVEARKPL